MRHAYKLHISIQFTVKHLLILHIEKISISGFHRSLYLVDHRNSIYGAWVVSCGCENVRRHRRYVQTPALSHRLKLVVVD